MDFRYGTDTVFTVSTDTPMPRLDEAGSTVSVDEPITDEFEVVWFDTEESWLAEADVEIWRQTGDDAGWYLRLPTPHGPVTVQRPLGNAVHTVPKPLRSAVQAATRGHKLRGAKTYHINRTKLTLLGSQGAVLAEVDDDTISTSDSQDDTPETRRVWRLKHTDVETTTMPVVFDIMIAAGATPVDQTPAAQPDPVRLRKKSPASDVLEARLHEQIVELRQLDPFVRLDTPDAVHKSRVAMRRLRSALATFRPFFDRDITDSVRDELKWIAGWLGDVRDTEVTHARLEGLVEAEQRDRPELVGNDLMPLINKTLHERYRVSHAAALEAMESERYFALLDQLEVLRSEPPMTELATRPAKELLPSRVRSEYKRLRRRIKRADRADDLLHRAELLHESRKAAKRVRYAAETLAPIYDDAQRFISAIRTVQTKLGIHHDSMIARHELVTLSSVATKQDVNALAFGLLYVREEASAATAEKQFWKAWKKASRPKKRRWLQ